MRDAPFNWFNFYDFWGEREHSRSQQDPTPPAPAAADPVPGMALDDRAAGGAAAGHGPAGPRARVAAGVAWIDGGHGATAPLGAGRVEVVKA